MSSDNKDATDGINKVDAQILFTLILTLVAADAYAFQQLNSSLQQTASILRGVGAAAATLAISWEAVKGIFIPGAEVQVARAMKIVACSALLFAAGSIVSTVIGGQGGNAAAAVGAIQSALGAY